MRFAIPTDWITRVSDRWPMLRRGKPVNRQRVGSYRAPPRGFWANAVVFALLAAMGVFLGAYIVILPQALIGYLVAPIAILALMAVWLLPETGRPPLTTVAVAFVIYTVLMILWPYYLAVRLQGLPLIEVRRAAILVGLAAFFVSLSVSVKFRGVMRGIVASQPLFFKVFAVFVALQVLSTVAGGRFAGALPDLVKVLIGWTGAFFIAAWIGLSASWTNRWRVGIILATIVLAGIGILESRNQGVLWANSIPSFLAINDPAIQRTLSPVFRAGDYRVVGTFSVPLSLAEYLFMAMPLLLSVLAFSRSAALRIGAVVVDIALWAVIIYTGARLGMVGAIITHLGFFLLWAYWLRRTSSDNIILTAMMYSFPLIVAAAMGAILSIHRLRVMVLGGGQHQASTDARYAQWDMATPHILKHPIFGYGLNQGGPALNFRNAGGVLTIDSGYLSLALDFGLLGLITYATLFIWGVVLGIRLAVRRLNEQVGLAGPLAIALIGFLVTRLVLSQNDNTSMAFMFLGMIIGLCHRDAMEQAGRLDALVPSSDSEPQRDEGGPLLRKRTQGPRTGP